MILSISEQTLLFLTAVLFGVLSAFTYDLVRVFRIIIKHKRIFIHIEDIIYWFLCAGILFLIMLQRNFGEIRGFTIVGAFIGMIIYFLSISRFFLGMSERIISILKKILKFIINLFLTPFRVLFNIIYKILNKFIGRPIRAILNKIKVLLIVKPKLAFNKLKIKKNKRQKNISEKKKGVLKWQENMRKRKSQKKKEKEE